MVLKLTQIPRGPTRSSLISRGRDLVVGPRSLPIYFTWWSPRTISLYIYICEYTEFTKNVQHARKRMCRFAWFAARAIGFALYLNIHYSGNRSQLYSIWSAWSVCCVCVCVRDRSPNIRTECRLCIGAFAKLQWILLCVDYWFADQENLLSIISEIEKIGGRFNECVCVCECANCWDELIPYVYIYILLCKVENRDWKSKMMEFTSFAWVDQAPSIRWVRAHSHRSLVRGGSCDARRVGVADVRRPFRATALDWLADDGDGGGGRRQQCADGVATYGNRRRRPHRSWTPTRAMRSAPKVVAEVGPAHRRHFAADTHTSRLRHTVPVWRWLGKFNWLINGWSRRVTTQRCGWWW